MLVTVSVAAFTQPCAAQTLGTLTTIPGRVVDLAPDAATSASFLYCTAEGEVGRLAITGTRTVLATALGAPFPKPLRALVQTPTGALVLLDDSGDLYSLPAAGGAATKIYADGFLVDDPTDLIVDTAGTLLIASKTPSTGVRALDFISANGQRWAYYLVAHQPLGLAADPLGPGVLFSDEAGGGALRRVDTSNASHPSSLLGSGANPGFTAAKLDGDLAALTNGDALYVAGSKLWLHTRATGLSSMLASATTTLRGVCIATSSGGVASASGWSAYLAEGEAPTQIREWGNVPAPAGAVCSDLGTVPDRGKQLMFFSGLNVFDLARDASGNLLVGGDNFGLNPAVRRITLPGLASTTIFNAASGLLGSVEGIALDAKGAVVTLTHGGEVQSFTESPFAATTLYADAGNQVIAGKDLLLTRQGRALLADITGFAAGKVWALDPGGNSVSSLATTKETRGLAVDPFTARALVTQWQAAGFVGTVDSLDVATPAGLQPIAGFNGLNYSNASSWGDGDVVADAYGNLYTASEDDWSLLRYDRVTGTKVLIGSSYVNHPSGLALAASTGQTPSSTGWSLYVAERNFLWELGGMPAPAPGLLDPLAPPIGRCAGFASPAQGEPRALCAEPGGTGLLLATAGSRVLRIEPTTRAVTEIAGPGQGLAGDLIAIAARPGGRLVVAARDGRLWEVGPLAGDPVTLLYADAPNALTDVRGMCLDGAGRVLLIERPAGKIDGRLLRLDAGVLQLLTHSSRGLRPAMDPLTSEVWLTEQGAPGDKVGEILRVDVAPATVAAGHVAFQSFTGWSQGDLEGGLAFDAAGELYVTEGRTGRLLRMTRNGGAPTLLAGSYDAPKGVTLAPGTPGLAGAQGCSAYVLDGWAVYEHGIAGTPAPLVPGTGGARAPLLVHGSAQAGASIALSLVSPGDPNRKYAIVPTVSGKVPGLPLSNLGDPDTRVLPCNIDSLFPLMLNTAIMPGFIGKLDLNGQSAPITALNLPPGPSFLGLEFFVDFAYVVMDPSMPNGVGTVGSTAQLYLGL